MIKDKDRFNAAGPSDSKPTLRNDASKMGLFEGVATNIGEIFGFGLFKCGKKKNLKLKVLRLKVPL